MRSTKSNLNSGSGMRQFILISNVQLYHTRDVGHNMKFLSFVGAFVPPIDEYKDLLHHLWNPWQEVTNNCTILKDGLRPCRSPKKMNFLVFGIFTGSNSIYSVILIVLMLVFYTFSIIMCYVHVQLLQVFGQDCPETGSSTVASYMLPYFVSYSSPQMG